MSRSHSGVGRYVTAGARSHPSRTALVHGNRCTSYAELEQRSNQLATAMLHAGLVPGDRVALWLDNCIEYVETYVACAKAGLVVVPVNVRFTPAEAEHVLQDSGARCLVFDDVTADRVARAAAPELLVGIGEGLPGCMPYEGTLSAGSAALPTAPRSEDLLVIGYTSGTTGLPKGAELTHGSVERVGLTNAVTCRYRTASVQVFALSLSFTATVPAHVLPHLYVGGTTVLQDGWETDRLLDAVVRHDGTFVICPTPVLIELADGLERVVSARERLVSVLHSASKAPPEHLGRLVEVLGERVVEGWGATENSGGLYTASAWGDLTSGPEGLASAGRAVPGTVVEVRDELDAVLTPGEVGQLVVSSPALLRGYRNRPQDTAAALAGGWFRTGDLGTVSEDGLVTVLDRRNDLINSGGMNVYPSEVEQVLLACPGVQECVVVAAPHERWGQVPIAFVVSDRPVDSSALLDLAAQRLAKYKLPAQVIALPELPRNTAGKVLRRELAARLGSSA